MRRVHRSLKRNSISYTLSNSNFSFGVRIRGFIPPESSTFPLVFDSSISPPSRLRSPFNSIIPIAPPPITPFNSTLLNSNSSLRFQFLDRTPLSIPFPSPSITLPISLRLHPLRLPLFPPPLITTLLDYTPFDYNPVYLSLSLSIHSFDRDGWPRSRIESAK